MNKSLAKKGLIVLAASIILFVIISMSITSSPYGQIPSNVSLGHGKYYYVPLIVNNSQIVTIFFQSTNSTTFLLLNSSGFSRLSSAYNSTGTFPRFKSLEGLGLIEGLSNTTSGSFPYINSSTSSSYFNKNMSLLQNGSYYAIFYNPSQSTNEVYYIFSKNSETLLFLQGIGSIFTILLFAAGVIIIIYALIKGPGKLQSNQEDQKRALIEAEYSKIEKGGKKGTKQGNGKTGKKNQD